MNGNSAIEWTNQTWNPVVGCTRISAGCDHCYAFALHDKRHEIAVRNDGYWAPGKTRMPRQYTLPFSTIQLLPERLEQPLHLRRPSMIFVNSMSDLFHTHIPDAFIMQVFDVMQRAHWHTFQILTKRVGRLRRMGSLLSWPSNVWIGVSIEQDQLTRRADVLRTLPSSVKFLSCEPLLGPLPSLDLTGIDWVIVGGESGPHARPLQSEWVTDIRDKCVSADIPFFFKQWGGRIAKAGGRLLENRLWDEYPQVVGK